MKTLVLFLVMTSTAFAGGDVSSTIKCDNGSLKLTLKRKGSFFGKDWIKLSKSFFSDILDEGYEQDWSPEGATLVEQLVKKEQPCSNEDFYQFLESDNAYVVQSYTQGYCEAKGERSTIYIQLKETNEIIKFDNERHCKSSHGM